MKPSAPTKQKQAKAITAIQARINVLTDEIREASATIAEVALTIQRARRECATAKLIVAELKETRPCK